MTTSPARLAANRQNALKSTGPKTAEGRAASRLNAFQHGLAGEGILLAPGEDSKLVDDRARAFTRELGAVGDYGGLLAHRAALLSVRMERSADREMAVVASNIEAARDQYDEDRLDEVDGWINDLDEPSAFRTALELLECAPEGLDHLIEVWGELLGEIRSEDPAARHKAASRATLWLKLNEADALALEGGQVGRIDAEIQRLRLKAETSMASMGRAINSRRDQAGIIASFDPSPEAALAHRYEAAAERGMYRAIKAIAEIRQARQIDLTPIVPPAEPSPPARKAIEPTPNSSALGSFRAEALAATRSQIESLIDMLEPQILPGEARKKRPDLRKINQKRR